MTRTPTTKMEKLAWFPVKHCASNYASTISLKSDLINQHKFIQNIYLISSIIGNKLTESYKLKNNLIACILFIEILLGVSSIYSLYKFGVWIRSRVLAFFFFWINCWVLISNNQYWQLKLILNSSVYKVKTLILIMSNALNENN